MKNQKNNLINQDYLVNSLADFEIICPLGRGAHSFVYEVKSRSQGNHYALKIIDKLKLQEQNLFERLKHEISIQMKLNHPNILKLYHSFEDEDSFYLVLELAKGGELYTYLKSEGKLNEKQSRHLIKQLIDGLIYLHSEKVLHRDLKLSNLLLTQNQQLKIGDFGLAVQLQDHDEEHQTMCGTPNYIPPEIVSRQPYGMTADV